MVELSWMHTFIHVYSIEIDHVFHGKNPSLGSSVLLFVVVFSLFSPRGTRCGTGYPGLLWCQVPMALMEHYWKKRDSFAPRRRGIYRPKYGGFYHDTLGMYLVFWLIDGFLQKGPLFGTVPVPIHSSLLSKSTDPVVESHCYGVVMMFLLNHPKLPWITLKVYYIPWFSDSTWIIFPINPPLDYILVEFIKLSFYGTTYPSLVNGKTYLSVKFPFVISLIQQHQFTLNPVLSF